MEIENYIVATDQQLVEMVLGGDDLAFTYLFQRYGQSIHRLFVQRMMGDGDIDDLLQETFIKVYLNLDRYNPNYTFGQWCYTIARNTFVDYVRKRQGDVAIDEKIVTPISPIPTPEERVISRQQCHQLEGYMLRLSPKYRQLIELRFFDELSYEEIAQKLALPLGTVKTQIHRARARMCQMITDGEL